jgi:NADPH:quinone reductase-like Zn-dependent oxidoreductase
MGVCLPRVDDLQASGVGTSAIQLAKLFDNTQVRLMRCVLGRVVPCASYALVGADVWRVAHQVIITASKDKLRFCHELGADETVDRNENEGKWVDRVLALTQGKGVDIIIDFVGSSYWEQNLAALAMGTRSTSTL